jgi:signal transduction histidine kinase/CheY-like chemotaxis protein
VLWGPELTLVYNDAAAKLLGPEYHPRVLARSGRELWPALADGLRTGEPVSVEIGEDGETLELTCSPIHDDVGTVAGMWAEMGDAPDEVVRRAEARAKDDFLALFGHEIRNPLSAIMTTLQILQRQSTSVELELMGRAVHQLTRLVDDLLDLSRLQRGKLELHRTKIEAAQVIELAMATQRDYLAERKARVDVHVPPTGLSVECDPDRLAQAIGNAIHNAAKYSEPSTTIAISAGRTNGRVSISVRDKGSGVAPERLADLFEAFQTGSARPHDAGLGLGLAIARNLMQLHGGEVRAASEGAGKGTEIVFELPLDDGTTIATHPRKSRKRVMLVEDNHDTAIALQRALELLGYQVAIAHNGPVALTVARAFQPDVALLDINLPVMDGWELSRRLRALLVPSRAVHFVAVTARDQEIDKQRSSEAGFADHLVKPIDLNKLERIVESLPDPPPGTP